MASQLIPDPLYHPSGGINLDANGLVARPNECIDGVNIDIATDRVIRRRGTKAFPVPTNIGSVLKFHRYIHPTRGSLLFAFCATNIYQYDTTYGWISVYQGASFLVNSWSVTDIIDQTLGSTVVAAGCTYTRPTEGYSDGSSRILLIYDNQVGFELYGLNVTASSYGNSFFTTGVTAGPTLTTEIEFLINTGAPGGYFAGAGDFSYDGISYHYIDTAKMISIYCGDYSTTVQIPVVENVRYSIKVVGSSGDVYLNGVYYGTTGNACTSNGYKFSIYSDYAGETSIVSNTQGVEIFRFTINGASYAAHPLGYFFNISDSNSRLFNRNNSIPVSEVYYNWDAGTTDANSYRLVSGTTVGHYKILPQAEPSSLKYDSGGGYSTLIRGSITTGLAEGEWDWADDDTPGTNALFVRLAGDIDPDTVARMAIIAYSDSTSVAMNQYLTPVDVGLSVDVGFSTLQLKKNLYDSKTYSSAISSPGIQTWSLTAARTIVTGTAYLVTDGSVSGSAGVLATASFAKYNRDFGTSPNLESRIINRWVPVDESEVAFSEDSYIDLTTGDISVEFLKSTYDTDNLTIYYQYEEDVDYRPLHVSNYHNALILANTAEYYYTDDPPTTGTWVYTPWRTRWSEQGNIRLFRESYYQDLALDDITPILGMKSLETSASSTIIGPLYFLKHNSIVRGTYNQNYNINSNLPVPMFNFEVAYSEGVESTNTAVNVGGIMFYLGRNDVYAFNGVSRISLTKDQENRNTRIQRTLISNLNINYQYRNFGMYDEIERKYYLFVVLNTSSSNYPEDCFVYDLDRQYWVRHTYSQVSAAIDTEIQFEGTIDGLSGSIDSLSGAIDDLTNNTSKQILLSIGDYTYYSAESDKDEVGVNPVDVTSYFITRDFLGRSLEAQDRTQRVMVEAKGGDLVVSYNTKYAVSPARFLQSDTLSFGGDYNILGYNCDVVATAIRFMITLGVGTEFRWLQVFSNQQELIGE